MELLNLLFPPRCPICQDVLEDSKSLICKKCYKKVIFIKEPFCFSCGKQLEDPREELCFDCKKHPKSFDKGRALCFYNDEMRVSLSAIKYHNQRDFVKFYAAQIKNQKKILLDWNVDLIVPVPLHPWKQRKRGFNQAMLFAKEIGIIINKPVDDKFLIRRTYTTPQKTLGPMERVKNLEKAFAVNQKERKRVGIPRSVLLVDDIYTTGATVESCARVLKKVGVQKVYVYCIAIGRDI
ncbi:MAG: ComF family protein [Anaerostipes sp.]|nr:ComF family protein [Anaerostipes sp.]